MPLDQMASLLWNRGIEEVLKSTRTREILEMQLNLSEEERAALTRHLCEHIRHTAHPFAKSTSCSSRS